MRGDWTTTQLVEVVRLFVLNMDVLDGLETGLARLTAPLRKIVHALRRNSRAGARRNISAHYDLGNEFFRLFLDETMMYSSATFEHPAQSLYEAQLARLDLICRKLELQAHGPRARNRLWLGRPGAARRTTLTAAASRPPPSHASNGV